jgi:hypothetical protein
MDQYNIKSKINYRQALEKNTLMRKSKETNKIIIIISLTQIEVIIEN